MNESAILHYPESKFCYALNKNTLNLRLRISRCDNPEIVEVVYGSKYTFASEQHVCKMERSFEDRLFAYYTAELKLSDVRFVYVFRITENGKIYFFSEDGLTERFNYELSYYNCFQYAYINEADIAKSVDWMRTATFYQIFVERFNQGEKNKDLSYVNMAWTDKPNPKSFAGGDLQGILDELDYIGELGVNTVYLTPIFKSV